MINYFEEPLASADPERFVPSSPVGGGVGQKLKVDIVGRWGRVAPMKKKIIRSQERWGRVS